MVNHRDIVWQARVMWASLGGIGRERVRFQNARKLSSGAEAHFFAFSTWGPFVALGQAEVPTSLRRPARKSNSSKAKGQNQDPPLREANPQGWGIRPW